MINLHDNKYNVVLTEVSGSKSHDAKLDPTSIRYSVYIGQQTVTFAYVVLFSLIFFPTKRFCRESEQAL